MHGPPLPPDVRALVVRADVSHDEPGLAGEPVTTAELALPDGTRRVVRIVGGPGKQGGAVRIAGRIVPVVGQTVRLDLAQEGALSASGAHAWTPNSPAGPWDPSALPLPFTLALGAGGAASRDLATADAAAEVDVALRTWTLAPCTAWRSTFTGTAAGLTSGDDGVNGVFWHDTAWPAALVAGAVGQTVLHVDAGGRYHDADVHLNGADYSWSLDGHGGTVDARSVLTHELGHALGLGHSGVAGATMEASVPAGIAARSLEQDDRDGVCSIYPGTGAAGCEAGPSCPGGFVCVARYCERDGTRGEVCAPCARVVGACAGSGDDARCIDIGSGATAGRVCGRACTSDPDCGPRFKCLPTTTSGDLQCVSNDACASGPDPCATDGDCGGDSTCRAGACVGAVPATDDAGIGAQADAEAGSGALVAPTAAGGGCATGGRPSPSRGPLAAAAGLALAAALRRRRQCARALPAPTKRIHR